MTDIIPNLKKFISNFIENRQFAKMTTGMIESVDPLKIKLENDITLDSDMCALTWTDKLTDDYKGLTVHLLRQDGGGFYYVLYKKAVLYKREDERGDQL